MNQDTITTARPLRMSDFKHAFAVPGSDSLIDIINPSTGRSHIAGEDLEQIAARYPGAVVVSIDDFCKAKAARQDSPIGWDEVTEESYQEMLNVLPPELWAGGAFLVGEPSDHHATTGAARFACYVRRYGKHYQATRPISRAEFRALFTRGGGL